MPMMAEILARDLEPREPDRRPARRPVSVFERHDLAGGAPRMTPAAPQNVERWSDARLARMGSVAQGPTGMPGSKGGAPERHGAIWHGEHEQPKWPRKAVLRSAGAGRACRGVRPRGAGSAISTRFGPHPP
eukprot:CAMPEP_0179991796 /NCGR_PEP_ID=MMETSP0984-20121128/5178_1 /TAXON_ID=483367 /ORGANISM="non described non described, Strain CCMP 2436" /LENGTH=130 /DNA_ID=CAMNT_0021911115 /DNA_START=377 /DNA_END=765 /DNA_ORIENTATION=-